MRSIYAIARLTILEALRSKILISLALFFAGILVASHFVQYLTLGEQGKILKDLCLGLLSLFTCILGIVLPIEQMQREKERNSLVAILAKPVHRYSFIAGKYSGICAVLAMVTGAMTVLILLMMLFRGAPLAINIVKASVMVFCQGLILASCSLFFATMIASHFLSMLCGISLYLTGNLLEPLREWLEHAQTMLSKLSAILLLYLVPHLENLNMQDMVALGDFVPWRYVAENVAYSLTYATIVFLLSAIIFNQKDI